MSLAETVRGQVAELFGKYRPAAGLSAEEIKAIGAERTEFASRIVAGLRGLAHSQDAITREFRRVIYEIRNEPWGSKMPTAEGIVGRVRSACSGGFEIPWCVCCEHLGGTPGYWIDSPLTDKSRGAVKAEVTGEWWCGTCHEALAWYWNRELFAENGRSWGQAVPTILVPKNAWRMGVEVHELEPYTDGLNQGRLALFVRRYVRKALNRPAESLNL